MLNALNGKRGSLVSDIELVNKTVLVITLGYPHPKRGASSVLFYWYLDALRKSKFNVEHLILVSPDEQSAQAENEYLNAIEPGPAFRVRVFAIPRVRDARRSGLELQVCELPRGVVDHVASVRPDATVCFDLMAADMARRMNLERQLIWLGDLSFQTGVYHAYYDFKAEPRKFPGLVRAYLAGILWRRYYRRVLRGQKNVIASSNSSVAHLARLGVASRYWSYPWPGEEAGPAKTVLKYDQPTFIMFGTLVALGSRSAFDFLMKSVYPLLIQAWGARGFSMLIAGMRELPAWVRADIELRPEFKFLGFVDDLGAEVVKCHAVLAPISVPVGNRSRIVTAMSMGALVIAHANTALGNPELISGDNCLLASSAAEFAQKMLFAYEQPDFAAKLGASARQTYLRSFEPAAASQRLVQELNFILNGSIRNDNFSEKNY
ncbi:glycosyltransferase [Laribacter hongkongensis]|uniref:glycosyltransferase n=1 Tax=Laribacter hongkongensis TaxID=168471 RepID=UPI001EFE161E|nr:glycosyltransferase [Laribacter hongkongensis]MCG9095356.1 glycosyltransferase [Laribacter hongkongensis]